MHEAGILLGWRKVFILSVFGFLISTYHWSCMNFIKIVSSPVFLNSLQWNRIISIIINEVESNISKNTLLTNFRMGFLPSLCKTFVELVEILVSHLKGTKKAIYVVWKVFLSVMKHFHWNLKLFFLTESCWSSQARYSGAIAARHVRSCYSWYYGKWK